MVGENKNIYLRVGPDDVASLLLLGTNELSELISQFLATHSLMHKSIL